MTSAVDQINLAEMRKPSSIKHYSQRTELSSAEQAALDCVAVQARGRRILDIGVGGGRTVNALLQVSPDYVGVDNSMEMVVACRGRYPGVSFEHADARAMSTLPDASVHLAMFSCNGIGMVAHEDRLSIMREVHRVLEPGGVFLFSTHNQNCPDQSAGFKLPELTFSRNPARLLVRLSRFALKVPVRVARRYRYRKHEIRTAEYSMINDVCHDYGVMLYYITLANQRRQLEAMGFEKDAEAFDADGEPMLGEGVHSSMMLIARKALLN